MPVCNDLYYFHHDGGSPTSMPLILLHGAGGSHLSWPAELRRMSGYRVHSLDLPGHGKSGGVGKHAVGDYARAVIDFMDAVGIWKAALVGHAMGGAVALSLALQASERTAGLGLISCGVQLPVAASVLENASNPTTYSLALQALLSDWFSPLAGAPMREQAARLLAATRPAVLLGDLVASNTFDVSTALDDLRIPTLVICGTEDRITPLHQSKSLSNAIMGAALQTIDDAGHALMLEQPRRVTALLSVFLKTIPYTPG